MPTIYLVNEGERVIAAFTDASVAAAVAKEYQAFVDTLELDARPVDPPYVPPPPTTRREIEHRDSTPDSRPERVEWVGRVQIVTR